jgi:Spy/CpxP family protein refolding chaperone
MRTASRWVLVAAVAFAVAGVASAQEQQQRRQRPGGGQPGGGFGGGMMMRGGGGLTMLLTNESVQKELKFTDDQKTKAKEFAEGMRKKREDALGGGQFDREKFQAFAKESAEAADKFVKDNLTADQQKRIKQINYQVQLQMQGPGAFMNEDVQKALKITDDQKDKFKGLGDEMRKDMQELGRGFDAETMQKRRTITKEYTTKATDALTADQKAAWKDLTGEPFEFKMDAPGGRRGGTEGGDTPRRRRPGGGDNPPPAGGNRPARNNNDPPPV